VNLSSFCERIFSIKNILFVNSLTSGKRKEKEPPKKGKIKITKSLQYERVLKIFCFHISVSPNLAKHTCGLSPLEQHHKIVKTILNSSGFYFQFLLMDFIQKKI
jgi:hypothetical protein